LTYQWFYNATPIPAPLGGNDSTIVTNLPGDYQLQVTNSTCGVTPTAMSATLTVTASAAPTVTLSAPNDSVCSTASNFTITGTPLGGEYLSPYVDPAGTFYVQVAGVGNHPVVYKYTTAGGCVGSDTLTVVVGPNVSVSIPVDSICTLSSSFVLSGGTPAGGTYSGTGVTAGSFDPAIGTGTHIITYTYTDGLGCTNQSTDNIFVYGCLGLEDLAYNNILLYPNPADGIVNLSFSSNINAQMSLNVLTIEGKLIQQKMVQVAIGSNLFAMDISMLPSGIYFIQLNDGNNQFTKKIVIR